MKNLDSVKSDKNEKILRKIRDQERNQKFTVKKVKTNH
jgi:hypothetical protein